jgi:hypothetical protein
MDENSIPTSPRKRLCEAVAENILEQERARDLERQYAAAEEEPRFDAKKGASNFGKRIAAKIALAQ